TLINGVFFDRHHCRQAYISELKGRQHDARFNQSRAANERDTR
ncbi:TPA: DNA helicase UvrD, partial [Neisseria gonorrhoeae]